MGLEAKLVNPLVKKNAYLELFITLSKKTFVNLKKILFLTTLEGKIKK